MYSSLGLLAIPFNSLSLMLLPIPIANKEIFFCLDLKASYIVLPILLDCPSVSTMPIYKTYRVYIKSKWKEDVTVYFMLRSDFIWWLTFSRLNKCMKYFDHNKLIEEFVYKDVDQYIMVYVNENNSINATG